MKTFVASFSGGKDSTLAIYKAMKEGKIIRLITMLREDGERSRSHGLTPEFLSAQAEAMGIPLFVGSTTWEGYEKVFKELLTEAKGEGAETLVTGDIDVPEHESWHERVTKEVGLELYMPLWKISRSDVVKTFIEAGFITKIVTVNLDKGMKEEDLGRILNLEYMEELEARGIDPCGEAGEFHTVVIDGPIFKAPVPIQEGPIVAKDNYRFLQIELEEKTV